MGELDDLLRRYQAMGDDEFTYLATHEAAELTPEALVLVRDELRRRGTVPDADAAIDVQFRGMESDEFERMLAGFRSLPCPLCGRADGPLNALAVKRGRRVDTVVGCRPCLARDAQFRAVATVFTAPVSLRTAASSVSLQESQLGALDLPYGSPALRQYVWDNRGEYVHLARVDHGA